MSDADVKMPPLPEPAAWRWPVRKLRGVEWRYTLYETRRNAVPLYTADQLRAAILAERERCAKVCEAESTAHGGVAAGPMTTERGKLVYEAMAAGAKNCAAAIREGDK